MSQPLEVEKRSVQVRIPEDWIMRLALVRPTTPLATFGAEAFLIYLEEEEARAKSRRETAAASNGNGNGRRA